MKMLRQGRRKRKANPSRFGKCLAERDELLTESLVGNRMKIIHASDSNLISKSGIVIDETKNTLKIKDESGRELVIPKLHSLFEFELNQKKLVVSGTDILGTVAERIYKF